MADVETLRTWLSGLGLEVGSSTDVTRDQLEVTSPDAGGATLVVRRTAPDCWQAVYEQAVTRSDLDSEWRAPWDAEPPTEVLARAARQVAVGFPLVEVDARVTASGMVARFTAPVFEDGLTRQAFGLTISSVLKAAQSFQLLTARRAEQLAAWTTYETNLRQRELEHRELIETMTRVGADPSRTEPAPASTMTRPTVPTPTVSAGPTPAWTATHQVRQRAQAWERPDPTSAVTGTIERRVSVQVLERQGDWAHVRCANGWSAWIDGRRLKPR